MTDTPSPFQRDRGAMEERLAKATPGVSMRQQIVAEIMSLVRQQPRQLPRPTIDELERLINSESTDAVNIEPNGSVSVTPTTTTVGAVADKVVGLVEAYAHAPTDLRACLAHIDKREAKAEQMAKALSDLCDAWENDGSITSAHKAARAALSAWRAE